MGLAGSPFSCSRDAKKALAQQETTMLMHEKRFIIMTGDDNR